jgi:hypothetical protein
MGEHSTDPLAEITAMKKLAEALSELDAEATARVLRWAGDHYGVASVAPKGRSSAGSAAAVAEGNDTATDDGAQRRFGDLAELHAAASPSTDADRALLAGYWFQFVQGESEFGAQAINSALKNLGHGVSNITSAFETLKAQKPALVMQLKKAGTSKQARKTYKLTAAGKNAVELLIGQH